MNLKLIPLAIIFLILAYMAGLSFTTRHDRIKAEGQRELEACPDTPNCVSSLSGDRIHAIEPLPLIDGNPAQSWARMIDAIEAVGGKVLVNESHYCHAVFSSRLFRFKDDFEARLSEERIDIRSASRAGSSDMGQNRKRVEALRRAYTTNS